MVLRFPLLPRHRDGCVGVGPWSVGAAGRGFAASVACAGALVKYFSLRRSDVAALAEEKVVLDGEALTVDARGGTCIAPAWMQLGPAAPLLVPSPLRPELLAVCPLRRPG